jgi:hypothetical protein
MTPDSFVPLTQPYSGAPVKQWLINGGWSNGLQPKKNASNARTKAAPAIVYLMS